MKYIILIALLTAAGSQAAENMIGRQSQNEGITVVPTPGNVTVDGDLSDWDLSGRICCFADQSVRNRYSAEPAAMWDKEALYLSVKWHDPTPMFNTVDPDFNPTEGWKADAVQLRIMTEDQASWVTTWYYTPKKQPVFLLDLWKDQQNSRNGQESRIFLSPTADTKLGDGVELAYRKSDDNSGFIQEARIPWKLIFKKVPEIKPELFFKLGFEFLWGDPTGQTWPIHRYADNVQPGKTSREFFWTEYKTWGNATLAAEGKIKPRRYISDEKRIEGGLPVRFDVPKNAARMTLVIEDESGNRVRNMAGDILPESYTVSENEKTRTVEVGWDGLDDAGRMVSPGKYHVRGLTHNGLGAEYEICFYNPGTPPWPTSDSGSSWGADHSAPVQVAGAGDWMIVSWAFAEGGSGIIGVGPDGLKRWGEKRGASLLTADSESVFGVPAGWHIKKDVIIRLDKKTGAYKCFARDGKELPFEYPLSDITGSEDLLPRALAVTDAHLFILLEPGTTGEPGARAEKSFIARVDKSTAQLVGRLIETRYLKTLAAAPGGQMYGTDGKAVYSIDPASGETTILKTRKLVEPSALTVDGKGNVLVMDAGPDQQIKAYSPRGKLMYTCGRKGGRPIRGDFDSQAMRAVSSIAVDSAGNVWAVESWDFPRRVSVWDPKNGKLVRDYVGNTGYAGTGCYLHDSDPNLAYVGPIELKMDKISRSWKVTRVLWVPDPAVPGECFQLGPGEHAQMQRFSAVVNGKKHEYLFAPPYRDFAGYKIFMETSKGWRPVAAITTVGQVSGQVDHGAKVLQEPSGEFAGLSAFDAVFWNDTNRDGRVQRSECDIVQPEKPRDNRTQRDIPVPMGSGWGERIAPDFTFYINGITRARPVSFTDEGAPVYSRASLQPLGIEERGDLIPVPEENLLLCLSFKGYADATRLAGIDTRDGRVLWSYANPYPGVHGSHRAPMPSPGLLIGPLKIAGVAEVNSEVGRVFVMRGNLGQDFFVTTDGLFVGALFQDGRLPGDSLPAKEEQLLGMPMENFSHGSEPFNGWFGKQADGKIRMTTGFPRQAAMILSVNGLESIHRFDAGVKEVTKEQLELADRDNLARAAQEEPPKVYQVKRFEQPPVINGHANEWEGVASLSMARAGCPFKGSARIAYDNERLYILAEVEYDSPWRNEGKDYTRLFKTGDAVDLQICVDGALADDTKRRDPGASDLRVVLSQLGDKPTAVLMRQVDPEADTALAVDYTSPVGPKHFDRVEVLVGAEVKVSKRGNGYTVEASIPLSVLRLKPVKGMKIRGDFGFISSDEAGTINTTRTYWANKDTNLVSDLPQEAWFSPAVWGILVFE